MPPGAGLWLRSLQWYLVGTAATAVYSSYSVPRAGYQGAGGAYRGVLLGRVIEHPKLIGKHCEMRVFNDPF